MKGSIFSIVTILATFLFSVNSSPDVGIFLQCLPNHSNPSFPISKAIYTPNNSSEFQSVLLSYVKNLRFSTPDTPKPLAIIAAMHESHVQATVICAKNHGLQIRIRSGGHDFEGFSYVSSVPFVVLDMFNLRSIDIDAANKTAWVQAGATLGELYHKIDNTSKVLAFPAGVCPTVGAGGHISGGGYGNMIRKYGLTVDNVIDATLVDANGKILDRKSMGEDLFWAIRGGGGASFAVILSWKINLVSVPAKVTVFKVNRTIEEGATDVVFKWQNVATKLPRELFIRAMPQVTNGSREGEKTVTVFFYGMFLGQADQLLRLMNQSFAELGLQQKDCLEMSWAESAVFWADFPSGTSIDVLLDRPPSTSFYSKGQSDYVKTPIPKKGLEKIWKMMLKVDRIWMQWNPYGGIMSEIPESATPFPHRRGYLLKLHYMSMWSEEENSNGNNYLHRIREFFAGMTPFVSKAPREAFLNYRDIDIGSNPSNQTNFKEAQVYGMKYFKANFQRLMKVKAQVDPDNFFKHEQSVPPLPH